MIVVARILLYTIGFILGTIITRLNISSFDKFILFLLITLEMIIIVFICYIIYIGGA